MEIGVGLDRGLGLTWEQHRQMARHAATLGYESVWTNAGNDRDAMHICAQWSVASADIVPGGLKTGISVIPVPYWNAASLASNAATVGEISGGRFTLGIGSGWFERDYDEYGYEFGTAGSRLRDFEVALGRIKARREQLTPPPVGDLPVLIGGSGEKVTLRLVAEHADAWNAFGPADSWAQKNAVLDEWCEKVGRDPAAIERTVAINPNEVDAWEAYAEAGAQHLIVMTGDPFDLDAVARLNEIAKA